jgi:threonine/homoserine/homoserine lactone efflux protein
MLIEPERLMIFAAAALALNLTPGSDMLSCLGQGLKSGARAGIAASLGIATGALIHIVAAGLGLAALLTAYPAAFETIRWAGVAYLVWLAIQAFRHPPMAALAAGPEVAAANAWRAWRDGIAVNLLNPKVAVFVLAFLPQFVDPARGAPFLQFLLLGAILNIGGTAINALVGAFAGGIGRVLTTSRRLVRAFQVLSGTVFLGLAARLAFERR